MKSGIVLERDITRPLAGQIIAVLGFSLLTMAGSWIRIPLPFTPVPITLQTFFVLLAGATLGPKRGAISQMVYLGYGAIGLPVFAGGAGGLMVLLGPTGGYLLAFPLAAWVTGVLTNRDRNFYANLGGFLVGSLPVLLLGTIQFKTLSGGAWREALSLAFIPFFAGEFVKSCFGAMVLTARNKIFSAQR